MSKIRTLLSSAGKGGVQRLRARLRRLEQMASWADIPKRGTRWIPLGNGKRAVVDASVYDFLNQWNWHCSKDGYVVRFINRTMIQMHSLILKVPKGKEVDHKDRDRLNNRRDNLRPCTKAQNQGNRWKSSHAKTSKFKGVYFAKKEQRFVAQGTNGGRGITLGRFVSEAEAAKAYNVWAKSNFGKFVYLNPV